MAPKKTPRPTLDPAATAAAKSAKVTTASLTDALASMTEANYGLGFHEYDSPPLAQTAFLSLLIPHSVLNGDITQYLSSKEWILPEAHVSFAPWVSRCDRRCALLHGVMTIQDKADVAVAALGRERIEEAVVYNSPAAAARALSALSVGVLSKVTMLGPVKKPLITALQNHQITSLSLCSAEQHPDLVLLVRHGLPSLQHVTLSAWDLHTNCNRFTASLLKAHSSQPKAKRGTTSQVDVHTSEPCCLFFPPSLSSLSLFSCQFDHNGLDNILFLPALVELHFLGSGPRSFDPPEFVIPDSFANRVRSLTLPKDGSLSFEKERSQEREESSSPCRLRRLKSLHLSAKSPMIQSALTESSVEDLTLAGDAAQLPAQVTSKFHNIKRLTLQVPITDLRPLSKLKRLDFLELSAFAVLASDFLIDLFPALREFRFIGHLEREKVQPLVSSMPSLKRLTLQCKWETDDCVAFAEWAGQTRRGLERLVLRDVCGDADIGEDLHLKQFGTAMCFVHEIDPWA